MSAARDVIAKTTHSWRVMNFNAAEREADAIISALDAAGFKVIHRDDLMKFLKAMEAAKETP